MILNIETKHNILDEVRYKHVDIYSILDGKRPKEEIREGEIESISIGVSSEGNIYVSYIMQNGDSVCSDCIVENLCE